jgi:pimeloyl-ACP methyl ester carboxylesterase
MAPPPVDSLPQPFDRPALFLAGRQDDVVGYTDLFTLTESYPRAAVAVLDRGGHALQIEQAQLFNALVNEWLERLAEAHT